MGAAYFYRLTETPLEQTLPILLGKARQAGWRVLVRGRDPDLLERLDLLLWQDGFLPHGQAGGPHDADQPVLLSPDLPAADFACIMAVDRAEVTETEVGLLDRVCILFDGNDDEALTHARGQWRRLTEAGCRAQYWAQDGGRWVMKSEK